MHRNEAFAIVWNEETYSKTHLHPTKPINLRDHIYVILE